MRSSPVSSGDRSPPTEILRVAFTAKGRQISFRKGQVLIRKGDHASGVYLILDGYVDVVSDVEPDMVLLSLTKGDIAGELGALTKRPRSASVVARTNGRAIYVSTTQFAQLLAEPGFVRALLKVLADKLILTTQRVEVLELRRTPARIAKALLLFHSHPELTHPPVTQRFLGHFCRVAERQVRRIVDRFEKEGLVEYAGKPRELRAKNPDGLKRIAEGQT